MPFGGARQLTPALSMVASFLLWVRPIRSQAWLRPNPYLMEADQFRGATYVGPFQACCYRL